MRRLAVLVSLLVLVTCASASACEMPGEDNGFVYMVCPFSVGGSTDIEVRGITPYFQKHYPAKVVNDNRTGGGGHTAINYVYQQPADGAHVLVSSSTASIKKLLNPEAAVYSETFLEAFIPVGSWVSAGGNVLATPRDSSITRFQDFVAAAQQERLSVAVPPPGSSDHMNVLMLEKAIDAKFNLVAYEGGAETAAAVMGGHVDAGIIGFQSFGDIEAFNLLGITSSEPIPGFPAPTFKQLGLPQVTSDFVVGAFVRAGTSPAVVDSLAEAFRRAHGEPEYQEWLEDRGVSVTAYKNQEDWADYLEDWYGRIEAIMPDLTASMEELGG
ncbi:tripartite tricarboxylate transporter substrate binding protein [Chloroflexota bacterium]